MNAPVAQAMDDDLRGLPQPAKQHGTSARQAQRLLVALLICMPLACSAGVPTWHVLHAATPDMHTLALLVGLVAWVSGALLCRVLLTPQRVAHDRDPDNTDASALLQGLAPASIVELYQRGLHDLFVEAQITRSDRC
jgi:hypothetical protein